MVDAGRLLKEATAYKQNKDFENAIAYLQRAYSVIGKGSTIYPVETFLRLPMYLHASGRKEEAWKEFNALLTQGYPNQLQDKSLICFDKSHVTDKTRLCFWRDRHYAEAVKYGIVSFLFEAAALKLQGRRNDLADHLYVENVQDQIEHYLSKAGKKHLLNQVYVLVNSYIKLLPTTDYNGLCRQIDALVLPSRQEA